MKNFLKFPWIVAVTFAATFLTSCDDEEGVTPAPQQTITQIAASNSNYSSLVAALSRVDLDDVLNQPGNYTVFAPTNAAFTTFLQANGFANLAAVPDNVLEQVLLNHVIADELFANELSTGYVKTLGKGAASNTNTLSLFVNTASGVRLNGVSSVVTTSGSFNINASNGVIHTVDAVIGLPTVVTHAAANPNFTSLVSALTRPGNTTQFVDILNGTASSPFTVFAPTNAAFTSLLANDLPAGTTLANLAEPTLDKVLKYHVITGGNVLASSLPSALTNQNTFLGQTFQIGTNGGARIVDFNNRTSNIVATDVQCANGVIHVLDKVLLPNLN
jgi:uncharacterized surface protein with fasciclin (FAS1) repeats